MAEKYLLEQYKTKKFPVIIIRPGNVFGPGHAIWVIYPIRAIQKNRISLIDNGKGIFLHTYIDNLIDAIVLSLKQDKAIGQTIDITDGDNNTTWGDYLNHLARLSNKPGIKRNMSKTTAMLVAKFMMFSYKIFRTKPWVTPMSVNIFTNTEKVSIKKAENLIGYKPKINYDQAIEKIEEWLRSENYIL
jgi:nucleoside-diphosphate-sugar epimerase